MTMTRSDLTRSLRKEGAGRKMMILENKWINKFDNNNNTTKITSNNSGSYNNNNNNNNNRPIDDFFRHAVLIAI
jgi:hypothetical protein